MLLITLGLLRLGSPISVVYRPSFLERLIVPEAQAPVVVQMQALILPDNVFVDVVEGEEDLPTVFERPVKMVHSGIESIRAKHDWLDPGYLLACVQ